jgi:hypothetical protein
MVFETVYYTYKNQTFQMAWLLHDMVAIFQLEQLCDFWAIQMEPV